MNRPNSLKNASSSDLQGIKGVCFDIDDTFSSEGKIRPEAFSALWKLKEAGFVLVPVTGRPAGWCDHIARFWPVDAVIGENGAFIFYMNKGVRSRLDILPQGEIKSAQDKLLGLRETILKHFPHAVFASDQSYREYDLAIDFCEDVPPWKEEEIYRLVKVCEDAGAHAKVSSIHVNTWFGNYDKQSAMKKWMELGLPGSPKKLNSLDDWIYVGDSPNDEPAFQFFKRSVGVANLERFLPRLKTFPTWITDHKSGEGFAELASRLLSL